MAEQAPTISPTPRADGTRARSWASRLGSVRPSRPSAPEPSVAPGLSGAGRAKGRPAAPRTPTVRVRRDVRWLASGIIAVALGGLGTWALFSMAADTRPAVKIVKTVYRGQVVAPGDLTVVPIATHADVAVVSGDQLNAVVGQTALTDLPGGGLLVAGSYGAPDVARGTVRVGVKVVAGRIPGASMAPGTPVLVIALPPSGASDDVTLPPAVECAVATSPIASADGSYLLDLSVPSSSAEQVARLAALGQVAIMQDGS